jgi:hypothetical protein
VRIAGYGAAKISSGSVIAVVSSELVAAIAIGWFLTFLDNRYHLTKQVEEQGRKCDKALQDIFGQLFVKPFSSFLYQLEKDAAAAQGAWMP